jgi:hypothetical protein
MSLPKVEGITKKAVAKDFAGFGLLLLVINLLGKKSARSYSSLWGTDIGLFNGFGWKHNTDANAIYRGPMPIERSLAWAATL